MVFLFLLFFIIRKGCINQIQIENTNTPSRKKCNIIDLQNHSQDILLVLSRPYSPGGGSSQQYILVISRPKQKFKLS